MKIKNPPFQGGFCISKPASCGFHVGLLMGVFAYRSTIIAAPMPPPMHSVARPRLAPFFFMA